MKKVYESTVEIESKKYNKIDSHIIFERQEPNHIVTVCEDGPIKFYYINNMDIIIVHRASNTYDKIDMKDQNVADEEFEYFCQSDNKFICTYDGDDYVLMQYNDKGFLKAFLNIWEFNGIEAKDRFDYQTINDISNGDLVFLSAFDNDKRRFIIVSDKEHIIPLRHTEYKSKLRYLYDTKHYRNFIKIYLFGFK